MLYNPEWKTATTKPTLDDFIGWLETKNPAETYDYQDRNGMCCLGQYMKARNIPWSLKPLALGGGTYGKVSAALFGHSDNQSVLYSNSGLRGRTFGGALERAKIFKKQMENA